MKYCLYKRRPLLCLVVLATGSILLWHESTSEMKASYNQYSNSTIGSFTTEQTLRTMRRHSANITSYIEAKLTKYNANVLPMRTTNDSRYLTCTDIGRLGNRMFQRASTIGIALQNNMIPVFKIQISEMWNLNGLPPYGPNVSKYNWEDLFIKGVATYNNITKNLSYHIQDRNMKLLGYLQSYKYFHKHRNIIKSIFTFNHYIRTRTVAFFKNLNQTLLMNSIWVGVHIRRGDFLNEKVEGKRTADVTYFQHAMHYFKRKLNVPVVFIVCGDDWTWNFEHILPLHEHVILSRYQPPEVDLAILSSCDHVIMSVGTFGWWGGYLSGGHVVYYKDFAQPRSDCYRDYPVDDYFPRNWIALS